MAVYGTAVVYGTGFVYGIAGGLYSIRPAEGPVTGGTQVEIGGLSFLDTHCDDSFNDAVIDPLKWTVTVVGAASSATESGGRLHLAASPVAASSARIASIFTVLDTDAEVDFFIQTPIATSPAPGPVELATLRLQVDALNYVQISRKTGGTFGDRYEAVVFVAGVQIEAAHRVTADLSGSLRIIRHGSMVYLLAGTTEVLRRTGFSTAAASLRVAVDNLAAAYAIQTDFDDFQVHTMVLFGDEPMLDANVISNDRILGTTPRTPLPALVSLSFATCSGPLPIFPGAFRYLDASQFVILAQLDGSVTTRLVGDPILRNLSTGRPGFLR